MKAYRAGVRAALHEENWPMGVANMMPRQMARAFVQTRRKMVARGAVGTLRWVHYNDEKVVTGAVPD